MPLLSRVPWARSSARAGVGVALAIVASVALAFASLPAAAAPLADPTEGVVTAMIVAYAPGVSPEDPNGNATGDEVLAADEPRLVPGAYLGFGFYRVDLSRPVTEAAARSIAAELAQFAKVTSAEPDLVMTAAATQDPVPAWGLDRIDQRSLPISDSYTYSTTGAGVTAYVVDSGIRASHVEVAGRVRNGLTRCSTATAPTTATATARTLRGLSQGRRSGWPRRQSWFPSACSAARARERPVRSSQDCSGWLPTTTRECPPSST
jgi:subtilisin family serine protease